MMVQILVKMKILILKFYSPFNIVHFGTSVYKSRVLNIQLQMTDSKVSRY